jgi:hypothetical protein
MQEWLVTGVLAYFAIGLLVFLATDTTELTSDLESRFVVAPYGLVREYVFFGVVTFWPLWLAARRSD